MLFSSVAGALHWFGELVCWSGRVICMPLLFRQAAIPMPAWFEIKYASCSFVSMIQITIPHATMCRRSLRACAAGRQSLDRGRCLINRDHECPAVVRAHP